VTAPREEKGRFVRADAKPVLHRQVSDADPFEWAEITKALRSEVGKPDPHGPRIELSWPLVFFVAGLVIVMVMGVDGGLW
jgi:hypothetical protein